MKHNSIIFAHFDDGEWMADAITKEGVRPLNNWETARFVWFYLKCGNGSLIKRLASVLKRLFTASLKPPQASFEK